jgi:hypothetical protein
MFGYARFQAALGAGAALTRSPKPRTLHMTFMYATCYSRTRAVDPDPNAPAPIPCGGASR